MERKPVTPAPPWQFEGSFSTVHGMLYLWVSGPWGPPQRTLLPGLGVRSLPQLASEGPSGQRDLPGAAKAAAQTAVQI